MIFRGIKYLSVLLIFVACKKESSAGCFKSSGDETTETRDLPAFQMVKVSEKIDLEIKQGTAQQVKIRAGENVLKNISTVVEDGKLIITNKNTCNFVRGYKKTIVVELTLPTLTKVESFGVGTVKFMSDFVGNKIQLIAESSGDIHLRGEYIKVSTYSNGNGDIYLQGACDSLDVFMNGTNFLYGNELIVKDYINSQTLSMGDCFLNAASAKRLDYQIYKNGNIYYRGSPTVIQNLNPGPSGGSLVKKDN